MQKKVYTPELFVLFLLSLPTNTHAHVLAISDQKKSPALPGHQARLFGDARFLSRRKEDFSVLELLTAETEEGVDFTAVRHTERWNR